MGKKKTRTRYGRDAPQPQVRSAVAISSPEAWKILCGDGYRPVMQCPEVQMCVTVYAELIASMTLRLMKNEKAGDVRVRNGLSRILDIEPNAMQTHMAFFETLVRALMENGFQVTAPVWRDGFLAELIPLPPSRTSVVGDGSGGYFIRFNGRRLEPDEVLHFILNPDPDEPWIGRGYTASLRDVVRSIRQANATRQSLQESPAPSIIVKVDGLTEEFASAEGRRKLREQYLDASDSGQPWFIPSEAFSVEQVRPLSLADLAIKDSLELDKRSVAAIFGLPPFLIGVGDFNLPAFQHFVTTRLMAVARIIEQTLTRGLLYSPDYYLSFNPRSLYSYSLTELVTVGKELVDRAAMRRNEWRDWLGLPPDPDMEEMYLLENYLPTNKLAEQNKLKGGDDNENQTDPDD